MKKNSYIPLPPFKGWVLQNFPFIEEDFDAITSYQLWCKVVEYLRAINNNVDVLAEQVLEFKNYFDNLDVQEEINNKLDEMAESGELTDIIAQYLQLAGILAFNTLNDLSNAENLNDGSFTKIYGKVSYNDGYGAFYKIRQLINTDVIDNDNLVALVNYPTLVAEKISNKYLEDAVNDAINECKDYTDDEIIEHQFNILSNDNIVFYVDNDAGDDSNDGSEDAPFKTFNRFLEEYKKYDELRCHFIGDGNNYTMDSVETFNSIGLHLENESNNANIVIDFEGKYTPAFYNCHLNIGSSASKYITLNIPNNLYFDGGFNIFNYTHFTGGSLNFNGCTSRVLFCTFDSCPIGCEGANLYTRDIVFNGTYTDSCITLGFNSQHTIRGSITNNATVTGYIIYCSSSKLVILSNPVNNGTANGLKLEYAVVQSRSGNYNAYKNIGTSSLAYSCLLGDQYYYLND